MRHEAVLEFSTSVTVDEKMVFINNVKQTFSTDEFTVTDISSAIDDETVVVYFSTSDGDEGKISLMRQKTTISTMLSFKRLIDLHTHTAEYFSDILVDLVEKYGGSNQPPEEGDGDDGDGGVILPPEA